MSSSRKSSRIPKEHKKPSRSSSETTNKTPKQKETKIVPEKEKKEEEQCGICLDPPNIKGALDSCTHPFCFECILQWSKTSNTCPFCKQRFIQITKMDPNSKKPKKIKVDHADQRPEYDGPESYIEWSDGSDDDIGFPFNSFGLMVGLFGFHSDMDDEDDSDEDEFGFWDEDDFDISDEDVLSEDISFPELNTLNPIISRPEVIDLTSPSVIPTSNRRTPPESVQRDTLPRVNHPEVPRAQASSRNRRSSRAPIPARLPSVRIASRPPQPTAPLSGRRSVASIQLPPSINQQRARTTQASTSARRTTVQTTRQETPQDNRGNNTTTRNSSLGRSYRLSSR